ncbi:MAG: chloride channel protein [Clostridiales bacterium]|nr:chloride channel protein [Clostridiales bacterium]
MMLEKILQSLEKNIRYLIKWTIISVIIGVVIGAVGAGFGHSISMVTRFWQSHGWAVFLMPVSGVLIVWLYRTARQEKNKGTDLIIESIRDGKDIPAATAPLIFAATVLSHAASVSTGREGAALQLGGGLANVLSNLCHLERNDRKICVMCGMSACFSALFGTPLAAAVFPMEMATVGSLSYAAMLPCFFASFLAAAVAGKLGMVPEHYEVGAILEFGLTGALLAVLIGILCALVGILMCMCLHTSNSLYRKYFPNPYIRILASSAIFILLTLVFSERLYNGSGAHLIELCFEGEAVPYYAFLLKILFTATALGAGFKGGEIVPALCVGATAGTTVAALCGVPTGMCAAIGMVCLFVSVTNCPVASVFIAFELFGFEAMPYYAIAVAVSFTLSGYYGLYHSQRFLFSKLKAMPYGDSDDQNHT